MNYFSMEYYLNKMTLKYVFKESSDPEEHFELFSIHNKTKPLEKVDLFKLSKLNKSTLFYHGQNYKTMIKRINTLILPEFDFIKESCFQVAKKIDYAIQTENVQPPDTRFLLQMDIHESEFFNHFLFLGFFINSYNLDN